MRITPLSKPNRSDVVVNFHRESDTDRPKVFAYRVVEQIIVYGDGSRVEFLGQGVSIVLSRNYLMIAEDGITIGIEASK